MWLTTIVCVLYLQWRIHALDNGLAKTPPMGWMSWERFRCNTDCVNDPDNCISAKLLMQMADEMAKGGYLQAGYEYLSVDDCWMAHERRHGDGRLIADPVRFPNGMKAVIDYVHSKGLKFGIYGDVGIKTCKGYPGNMFTMWLDAETYASWGVDMLKFDCCFGGYTVEGFETMGKFLNRTGRPIMYACALPLCMGSPNYDLVAKYCNMWRNFADVTDDWKNVQNIIKFYGDNTKHFAEVAGPGGWNDPDELVVGDSSLSHGQQEVQMGIWALTAAPLFMSVDLRNIDSFAKGLLLNKQLLAINQDPLGIQGKRVWKEVDYVDPVEGWLRPLSPRGKGRYAVGIYNAGSYGWLQVVNKTMSDLGLNKNTTYTLSKVLPMNTTYTSPEEFPGKTYGRYGPTDRLVIKLPAYSMYLFIAEPVPTKVNRRP